jgi:threonine dehydrogenase-like Zn-dependent dehydrogenase
MNYPTYTGDGMAATIVAVGKDVHEFKEGDRVAVEANHKQYFTFKPNSQDIHHLRTR